MVGIRKIQRRVQQGAPRVAHQVTNPTGIHEDLGSVPGLSQWVWDHVTFQNLSVFLCKMEEVEWVSAGCFLSFLGALGMPVRHWTS